MSQDTKEFRHDISVFYVGDDRWKLTDLNRSTLLIELARLPGSVPGKIKRIEAVVTYEYNEEVTES